MHSPRETDPINGELYLAGELVQPGVYREIDDQREVCLRCEDYLPASLNGRVACYKLVRRVVMDVPRIAKRSQGF